MRRRKSERGIVDRFSHSLGQLLPFPRLFDHVGCSGRSEGQIVSARARRSASDPLQTAQSRKPLTSFLLALPHEGRIRAKIDTLSVILSCPLVVPFVFK
jgi:hypothetical protein